MAERIFLETSPCNQRVEVAYSRHFFRQRSAVAGARFPDATIPAQTDIAGAAITVSICVSVGCVAKITFLNVVFSPLTPEGCCTIIAILYDKNYGLRSVAACLSGQVVAFRSINPGCAQIRKERMMI